jgi:hypothetical protein
MNGLAAFVPKREEFIRALPDSGKVFIRALTSAGANKATNLDDTTGIDYSAAETPIEGSRRSTAADPGSAPIPY